MIRRLSAALLALVLGAGLPQAGAIEVRYNNSVVLDASFPTAQYSSTYTPYYPTTSYSSQSSYCIPSPQFQNSMFNPGGPLLTPIVNNWLYWGNSFNWTGNNCTTNTTPYSYSYGASSSYYPYYPTSLSSGSYSSTFAPYINSSSTQNRWDANYTSTNTTAKGWTANYTPTVVTKNWEANYSPTVVTKNWNANYSPTTRDIQWNANYSPTVTAKNWNANYTPAPVTQNGWTANYSPTVVEKNWNANYSPTVVSKNWVANYTPTTTSSSAIVYPTSGAAPANAYSQVYAPYTTTQTNSGAAFGSLFGDGRDPAFEGSAVEGFVARLHGQTAPEYTTRAEALERRDFASAFDLNPVVGYTPVTNYDRSFTSTPTANLNATPTTGPATTSQAVQQASQNMAYSVPLQQNSTYAQDLQALDARNILPPTWKSRAAQTMLTREELAQMLIRLRGWRDGKNMSLLDEGILTLPLVTDMKVDDPTYFTMVAVARYRLLYMPEMREHKGSVISVKGEPKTRATRAQTLQAIMTSLYLRPNSQYSIAGYTDLTTSVWYTQWALTARAYGLDFGTRFDADQTVSQEEAVRMVATLLKQIR